MRAFLSLSFIALLLCLASCGSEEEEFLTPLVGTWESSTVTAANCTDPDENGTTTCSNTYCIRVTINSDGTYTLNNNLDDPPSTESGNITATSSTISMCESGNSNCGDADTNTYSLSGGKLSVTFTDDDSPGCNFTATFDKK